MKKLRTDEAVVRKGRVLLAFMSEDEAAAFLSSQTIQPFEQVRPLWQAARASYERLPEHDEVPPQLKDMPGEVRDELAAIEAAPVFQEHFGSRQYSFKLVEVDRLVAFQQFVDTEFSQESALHQLESGGALDGVKFCLPRDFSTSFSISPDPSNMSMTLASLSRNINVAGLEVVQAQDQPLRIAFIVRARANWVQVVEFEGRLFLKNGYHRVWVLRGRGDELVPAIVTKAHSVDEIGAGPGFFSQALILSDRPPLFRHFFDDVLAPELPLKSTMKVIRFTAQEFVLPRLP